MQCAANYLWLSGKTRSNHGLHGGAAFARLHIVSDAMAISSYDESNAFTSVVTPEWMWAYCVAPPL